MEEAEGKERRLWQMKGLPLGALFFFGGACLAGNRGMRKKKKKKKKKKRLGGKQCMCVACASLNEGVVVDEGTDRSNMGMEGVHPIGIANKTQCVEDMMDDLGVRSEKDNNRENKKKKARDETRHFCKAFIKNQVTNGCIGRDCDCHRRLAYVMTHHKMVDIAMAYDGTVRKAYGDQLIQFSYAIEKEKSFAHDSSDGPFSENIDAFDPIGGHPISALTACALSKAAYSALDQPISILETSPLLTFKMLCPVHSTLSLAVFVHEADLGLADAFINGDLTVVDKNDGLLNLFGVNHNLFRP
ncbi:hypothetical protein Cgig2_002979 [Carnegiea gigantea]|uniref:Uncharacterized protein n=1 Tax=Carnegiea gigantea TaxID=171969 RepID=A0A9Q1K6W7_9CARY|nr:hypothetical protein Cgig2_002979 [Carnegiea gigantea]